MRLKIAFAVATLILFFSLPATAQHAGGSSAMGGSSASAAVTGGGGGGGGSFGTTASLLNTTRTTFHVTGAKGEGFVPSGYLPFDKAVALGQEASNARAKSVAEAAAENRNEKKAKSGLAFVQDSSGRLTSETQ